MSTADRIHTLAKPLDITSIQSEARAHIDTYTDVIHGHTSRPRKKKRGLPEEVTYWQHKESLASKELEETNAQLPALLQSTQEHLATVLTSAQNLSIERYALTDKLLNLIAQLESDGEGSTVLEQMEAMQAELSRLQSGLIWVNLMEQVLVLSERILDPKSHHPSPLSALPEYKTLHDLVHQLENTLPDMTLLRLVTDIRDKAWTGLREILYKNLLETCTPLKWPLRVVYPSIPIPQRRAFERAYQDCLYLQAEGENLGIENTGLCPLQAMIQPIALRFKYHFQGSRNTNRVDKPEWAFTHILDQIYEHESFIEEYLGPLTHGAGYPVDVKSEFTRLLFPILLSLLRSRIPHLLDHPALLAHTIYQTVVFDESIRRNGVESDGLAGVLLTQEGWFDKWLAGEKIFAEEQFHEIISSPDAWIIDQVPESNTQPSVSARQVKALLEQITDRYSPLPSIAHRLAFLTTIQLPLLSSYVSRISASLDAFETLSSAFVRAVPGALAGNTKSGVHIDQTKLTSGQAGLERLTKAWISASWILAALRSWTDDLFFVELSHDAQSDVFNDMIERYSTLCARAEDMMVKHISVEVENDLKQHLTRRWDESQEPDPSYLSSLATYSSHLSTLAILPTVPTLRVYKRLVDHLSNHIQQRAVYAGWSKFNAEGGHDFIEEIRDWVSTSETASIPKSAVKAPWTRLCDIAQVLSLNDGEVTFAQAMAAAWSGEESFDLFVKRLGIKMGRGDLQGVLKRRVDCWR